MNNVIVTGATGFIGRALVTEIKRRFGSACCVVALGSKDVDLASQDETFAWFDNKSRSFSCDHIVHLATLYKAGDWPVKHPATQFHVNLSINVNLLEAWRALFSGGQTHQHLVLLHVSVAPASAPRIRALRH